MGRIFVIGDIHGCSKTFKMLLLEKLGIKKSDKIYCIGDYIDRGRDSKGVVDFILNLRSAGYKIHTLRGNHEEMMLDSTVDTQRLQHWLQNGGKETLKSFGIETIIDLPAKYLKFFKRTKLFIATDKYIFVHAGLNFDFENPFQDKYAMLWIRDEYFDKEKINDRHLIHGHTPIHLEDIIKQQSHRINIDGGCVYKNRPGLGNLVALELPEMRFIYISNID